MGMMGNILLRYTSVILILILLALNAHGKISEIEKTVLVNKWLEVTLNKSSKSKSDIMSKAIARLSDKDRFILNKHLSKKRKGRIYAKFDTLIYDVNGRLYSFKIQKKTKTLIVNGVKSVPYSKDNIWVSIKKSFPKRKKSSVFLWNPFAIDSAFAGSPPLDVDQLLKDGVAEELLTFAATQNFVPLKRDKDMSVLLREAEYNKPAHQRFWGLGSKERKTFTCNSRKTPPSISGQLSSFDDGLGISPMRYESNRLMFSMKGSKETPSKNMAIEFSNHKRTKAEEVLCVNETMRRWEVLIRDIDIIKNSEAVKIVRRAQKFSSFDYNEKRAVKIEKAIEEIDLRKKEWVKTWRDWNLNESIAKMVLTRKLGKVYSGAYYEDVDDDKIDMKKIDMKKIKSNAEEECFQTRLGLKTIKCEGCKSKYGVIGEVANTQPLEAKLSETERGRFNFMEEFREKYSLQERLEIDGKNRFKNLPETHGASGSSLQRYRTELIKRTDQLRSLEENIDSKLDRGKEILMDRVLLAGALSGCCGDNECKANIFEKNQINIVPAQEGKAVQ